MFRVATVLVFFIRNIFCTEESDDSDGSWHPDDWEQVSHSKPVSNNSSVNIDRFRKNVRRRLSLERRRPVFYSEPSYSYVVPHQYIHPIQQQGVRKQNNRLYDFLMQAMKIGMVVLFGYVIFICWRAIENDMSDRMSTDVMAHVGQVELCRSNYDANNCAFPVELTKVQCQQWSTCMSQSPEATGSRVETFVVALASVIQKFLTALSWETKFFLLFVALLCVQLLRNSSSARTYTQSPVMYVTQSGQYPPPDRYYFQHQRQN